MIPRLHRQFVVIAMGSLLLILLVILGTINAVNIYHTDRRIDGALHMISQHDGVFPEFDRDRPPARLSFSLEFQMTPETRFETRYFSVWLDGAGDITAIDTSHIAAVDQEEARRYARDILALEKPSGYLEMQYKYLLEENTSGALLIVMDCHNQLQQLVSFFQISLFVGAVSLALMFLLVTVLSRRALRPVEISLQKQKQFITDAGHEIKTPLAIISSNADVLELTYGDSEWLQSIRRQTARLGDLVKRLLTLTRMEESQENDSFTDVSLRDIVAEAADSFRTVAEGQGKTLSCADMPALTVRGDSEQLRQLCTILLDNAVKYASPGCTVDIGLYARGKRVFLEVRNPLDKLPDADPERLFDRFYRADSSRSRDSGGYGIGLSIAKAIAACHGAEIRAIFEADNRICFQVCFPRRAESATRREPPPQTGRACR